MMEQDSLDFYGFKTQITKESYVWKCYRSHVSVELLYLRKATKKLKHY